MLYETGRFVVTSLAPPAPVEAGGKRRPRVGHLARLSQTKSQSKVEDFECKSDSLPRQNLKSWPPPNAKP